MSEHEESETGSACSYELLPIEQQNHAHEARATWTNDSNTSPGHDATVCPTKFEHNNLNLSNVDGVDTQLDENCTELTRFPILFIYCH
jgi:hypothetical protein